MRGRARSTRRRYWQKALRRRVARSKWKWSRCASLASGPSTVPNTPHAPLCSRCRKSASALLLGVLPLRSAGHGSGLGVGADVGHALVLPLQGRRLAPRSGLLLLGLGRLLRQSVRNGADLLVDGPNLGRLGPADVLLGRRRFGVLGLRCSDPVGVAPIARRGAPGAHHVDGAAVGRDESGDVDGIGERMLAQPIGAERVAVARPAGVARGVAQPDDGGPERLARRRLQGLLHPGVQASHHGAVEHRRRAHLDLAGARADALQQHRGRRAANVMADGLGYLDLGGNRRQQPARIPASRRSSRPRTKPRAWEARPRALPAREWRPTRFSCPSPRPPAARLPG